jgi:hypothetical protein
MDEPSRRRPRARPPAGPGEVPDPAPARRRPAFVRVAWIALAAVAAVVAVALLTGTADDLPWGAVVGVVVIAAIALVVDRRRAAAPQGEEGEP